MQMAPPDLRDLARAAERVAADAGLENVAARLRDNRAERDRPGARVAVVGDVNRGKSTLVNRLLGADVLPTGSVPLTRAFVVVRALADGPAVLDVRWPSGAAERRSLTAADPWHGLAADHESSAVRDGAGQAAPAEPQLLLSTPSEWLSRVEVELLDTPGLHEGTVDYLLQTQRAVALSDVVIMVISAPSPLSLLERQFLAEELLTKRVPRAVVALTKVDQLPAGEVDDFLAWFRARIAEVSPGIAVVVSPGPAPAGAEPLAELRNLIGDLAHSDDLVRRRDRRLAWQLVDACMAIRSAARAAADRLQEDEASRYAAVSAAKQQLDEDDLQWNQLRLGLDERRLRLIETIRRSVTAATSELFENLDVELHRVTDIKAWWDRELPVRLRRELKNLTRALESQISGAISRDLGWLDSEVVATFAMTRKPAAARQASPVAVSEPPDLELADVRRRRTATRVVTAVGGIVGTVIASASGVGMPAAFTIGGTAIAAIIAERDADSKIEEQRTEVRGHLRRLLDDVVDQFREKLSEEVDHAYRTAFEELRIAQASRRTARLEEFAATTGTDPDTTTWTDIQHRADDIAGQVPADLDDEPDAGGDLSSDTDGSDQNDHKGERT
jgi:small GTP-binding protein